jgi:hypothetical protein
MLCGIETFGEEGVICIAFMPAAGLVDNGSTVSVQPMKAMSATLAKKDR